MLLVKSFKMKDKASISKVMSVWESENKILKPNGKPVLEIIDQIASLFSAGNYYYLIINFKKYSLDFVSESIKSVLGIEKNEFTLEKFFDLLHSEDLAKLHEKEAIAVNFLLEEIPKEDIPKYKVVYLLRLKLKNGKYKTILHQSRAINISKGGKIHQAFTVHTDITYLNIPIDHKISFISNERPSYYALETGNSFELIKNSFKTVFTKREQEIITKISEGMDYNEIAKLLFVSPHTISTHKKNILKKSGCKNTAELLTKCLREGVI
jgi:DNA-binding CsgD family transcriptional regulator